MFDYSFCDLCPYDESCCDNCPALQVHRDLMQRIFGTDEEIYRSGGDK